jgi:hypothetical protein
MLSLLAARSKKENFGVVSSGIIFIPSSVKINQVVQPFKSWNTHLSHELTFYFTGCKVRYKKQKFLTK